MRARMLRVGWKRNKSSSPKTKIGFSPTNRKPAKAFETVNIDTSNRASLILNSEDLTAIPRGSEANVRERSMINISGFDIRFSFTCNIEKPIYCNIAVIAPIGKTVVASEDFLRYPNSNRSVNFGNQINSMLGHTLPLNPDQNTILKHRRFMLGPKNVSSATFNGYTAWKNYQISRMWVPLKRQIRYDNPEGDAEEKIFLVYWFDEVNGAVDRESTNNIAVVQIFATTYFHDVV